MSLLSESFSPEFVNFRKCWKFVSRYGGVLSRFVKFNQEKISGKAQFHIFGRENQENLEH